MAVVAAVYMVMPDSGSTVGAVNFSGSKSVGEMEKREGHFKR